MKEGRSAIVVADASVLMVSMISEGLLDIVEADSIKEDWETRHRFRMKLRSFRDVCA